MKLKLSFRLSSLFICMCLVVLLIQPGVAFADDDDDDFDEAIPASYDDDDDWEDDDDDWDDDDDDIDDDFDDGDDDSDDDWERTVAVPVPNQAIVQIDLRSNLTDFASDYDATVLGVVPDANVALLQLDPDLDDQGEIDEMTLDNRVIWSELNYTSHAPEGNPRYFFTSTSDQSGFVNAPALPAGLDYTAAAACVDGSGIVVAVLDTGVDSTHPQLADNIVPGGWNTLDDSDEIGDTGNGVDDDGDGQIDELVGHGTHVTGSILQVAPNAQIMPFKVLDSDGIGTTFSVTSGIYHAVDQGAAVINLSLGSTHDSLAIRKAVEYAHANDVMVVAAAGNGNQYTPIDYPAGVDVAISVAAVDANGNKATYSNYNEMVDISAPGDDIASAYPDGRFLLASGTSMATPLVTGTIVLLLDRYPESTPAEVEELLNTSSSPLSLTDPLLDGLLGSGEVNIDAAIACDQVEIDIQNPRTVYLRTNHDE